MRVASALLLPILGACGGAEPEPAVGSGGTGEAAPPFHFVDVAAEAGLLAPTWCGRIDKPHLMESNGTGLALFDYDGDGDLDFLVANVDEPPTLLRNDTSRRGAWLIVDAPGALRVTVVLGGGKRMIRDAVIGGSYMSESDSCFHFGLGEVERVLEVEVVWPGGRTRSERGGEVNRVVRVGA